MRFSKMATAQDVNKHGSEEGEGEHEICFKQQKRGKTTPVTTRSRSKSGKENEENFDSD